jgi:Protein of unknown function (DUF1501)
VTAERARRGELILSRVDADSRDALRRGTTPGGGPADGKSERRQKFADLDAGLLTTLDLKGLLESTAVFVTGEFGRTPRVSRQRAGRDYYPRAMSGSCSPVEGTERSGSIVRGRPCNETSAGTFGDASMRADLAT